MDYTCKLGLNNTDGEGGEYSGKGIAAALRGARAQLQKDGYHGGDTDAVEPHVIFEYTREKLQKMADNDDYPYVATMMEADEDFERIKCLGFGIEDNNPDLGWKLDCKDCPYLQEQEPSAE